MDDSDLRRSLRDVFRHTMKAIEIGPALRRLRPRLRELLPPGPRPRVVLVAFGKAAVPMTEWILDEAGVDVEAGVVSAPTDADPGRESLRFFHAGHPLPNADSLRAGAVALSTVRSAGADAHVLFLISGGGSSLLEFPLGAGVELDDIRRVTQALISCGASIVDVNAVRKHLSAIKGGRLALAAAPARQVTLYVSDVPAGEEASIASGPTMPDPSTWDDVRRVIETHGLRVELPVPLAALVDDPEHPETPRAGDPCFARSEWIPVLSNRDAVEAAMRAARAHGWHVEEDASVDDIPVADAAARLVNRLHGLQTETGERPACIVAGGELSSPVTGSGMGGRNQAFVLECVRRIAGERIAVLSAGTDGIDGNSPAAGAVADGSTLARAAALGLDVDDHRRRSDSHTFFHRLGDDVTCGPTGNNVRDIRVLVSRPAPAQ